MAECNFGPSENLRMDELSDIQFRILDSLYFVESFDNILSEVGGNRYIVADELKSMLDRGWVQAMRFDEAKNDYVRTYMYDSDRMQDYWYLATREGLLRHHGRA